MTINENSIILSQIWAIREPGYLNEHIVPFIRTSNHLLEIDPTTHGPGILRVAKKISTHPLFPQITNAAQISIHELRIRITTEHLPNPKKAFKARLALHTLVMIRGSDEEKRLSLQAVGYEYFMQNKHEEATSCFMAALQLEPNDPTLLRMQGNNLLKQDKYDEAFEMFERAKSQASQESDQVLIHMSLGQYYATKKEVREMKQAFAECYGKLTSVVDRHKLFIAVLTTHGKCELLLKNYGDAFEYFERAIQHLGAEISYAYIDLLLQKSIVHEARSEYLAAYDAALLALNTLYQMNTVGPCTIENMIERVNRLASLANQPVVIDQRTLIVDEEPPKTAACALF